MKIVATIVAGLVLFVAYVWYLEETTVFLPSKDITVDPAHLGVDYQDIYFLTEDDVKLNGWFFPYGSSRTTILFFHGNAGNIGDRLEKVLFLKSLGLNVFIIDYRGYGKSEGKSSETNMYKDARAAYDYLLTRTDIDSDKIITYGVSLGGAAAIDLAVHRKVGGLIVDSTFSNAADMARQIFPLIPSFLIRTKLDSLSKIKSLDTPKLFLHSPDDGTVPIELGEKLFDAALEPKEFVEIKGFHNEGIARSKDIYAWAISSFVQRFNLL